MELALSSARAVMSPALPMRFKSTSRRRLRVCLPPRRSKTGGRESVDLVLDALDEVGHAVNDRFDQARS